MIMIMIIIINNDDASKGIKHDEDTDTDTDNRYDSIQRPHSIRCPVRLVSAPSILFFVNNHQRPTE